MQKFRAMLVLVILCLLATNAAALTDGEVIVVSNTQWLVAGNATPATITVSVTNMSVAVEDVEFVVLDPAFTEGGIGGITPAKDTSLPYQAGFTTKKSGTAPIRVRVNYLEGTERKWITKDFFQEVDHALPYVFSSIDYENELTVNETTELVVIMEDKYGNIVENRRQRAQHPSDWEDYAEEVRFVCSPADCGFFNGIDYSSRDITLVVGDDGEIRVDFKAAKYAGENIIWIDAVLAVPERWITIYGIADAVPVSVDLVLQPNVGSPPYVPADGASKFHLAYTFRDEFGNPSGNTPVLVSTSLGESYSTKTNNEGQVMFYYGPRAATGLVTITTQSALDTSVKSVVQLEFVSTAPVDMLLTANPQVMPSHDVDAGFTSSIRAKVIDEKGNPVANETVTFSLNHPPSYPASQSQAPFLLTNTTLSDSNGYATVQFVPGAFITDPGNPDYDQTASAACDVMAIWNGTTRTIQVEWKNFPYLRVETEVDNEKVPVGETVNVTVRLIGDGWALQPNPVDAVLVMDRSGSMEAKMDVHDASGNLITRIAAAKISAVDFVDELNATRDRIGVVSYDYENNIDIDSSLGNDFGAVTAAINALDPNNGATATRPGLKTGIDHLMANPNPNPRAVRAIILMTDGKWNNGGAPDANGWGFPSSEGDRTFENTYYYLEDVDYRWYSDLGGGTLHSNEYKQIINLPKRFYDDGDPVSGYPTFHYRTVTYYTGAQDEQNLAKHAIDNNILLYIITFADNFPDIAKNVFTTMAGSTGGFSEHAQDTQDLSALYEEIAGILKTEAGVDTAMELSFANVDVTNVTYPGDQVFDYVYLPGASTHIEKTNASGTIVQDIDQTADWGDKELSFDVGTIFLGETWEATFTLEVLKEGNIDVFGSASSIAFNGTEGIATLSLPDTYVTAYPDLNATGLDFKIIDVQNLAADLGDGFVDCAWNLNYTGSYSATQRCYYSSDDSPAWVLFDTIVISGPVDTSQTASLDLRDLPYDQYYIRVRASSPDTPDDWETVMVKGRWDLGDTPYIKIE